MKSNSQYIHPGFNNLRESATSADNGGSNINHKTVIKLPSELAFAGDLYYNINSIPAAPLFNMRTSAGFLFSGELHAIH